MIEVTLRPLTWKEDIVKTEMTQVIALAVVQLRSSMIEEQKMNVLNMAVENVVNTVTETNTTARRVSIGIDAAALNVMCKMEAD